MSRRAVRIRVRPPGHCLLRPQQHLRRHVRMTLSLSLSLLLDTVPVS